MKLLTACFVLIFSRNVFSGATWTVMVKNNLTKETVMHTPKDRPYRVPLPGNPVKLILSKVMSIGPLTERYIILNNDKMIISTLVSCNSSKGLSSEARSIQIFPKDKKSKINKYLVTLKCTAFK